MTQTCPTDEVLSELLKETVPYDSVSSVEEHLANCPSCLAKLDRLSNDPELADWIGETPYRPNPFPYLSRSGSPTELGTIARYRVQTEIGRGGMGIVFRAWDEDLRRYVALKVLRTGRDDAKSAERFAREARAAGKVRHDHLVPILDVIATDDGRPVIVMPLIAGPYSSAREG